MRIEYTAHARLRLCLRGIEEAEAERVLQSPQQLYYDILAGTMIAVGERSRRPGHWLLMAFTRSGDSYRVVTVIDTRSIERLTARRVASGRRDPPVVRRVYYDPEADILYIVLGEGPVEDTVDVDEDVFIELGREGNIVGIEVWRATENILGHIAHTVAARIRQQLAAHNQAQTHKA